MFCSISPSSPNPFSGPPRSPLQEEGGQRMLRFCGTGEGEPE
ncbi:hypothetical protein MC7420_291 [Coleofasciculus chthonoplastes PCC 7420]|uniref:Uncharacterized protein n=1 Tax=Coleofasciculus chthonoplastes PCC 7420 TaxID=118168 RepID=B4VLW8_9CYAN|nr:hypothetical protein MC7420_291 [Coleofasciculus chthonoplastes PCC 7420]